MAPKVKSSNLFKSRIGIFENIQYFIFVFFLGSLICLILTCFLYKYIIIRVNSLKNERKSFYECGFKPNIQKPIQISLQFIVISILFILFDTDLLFFYPLVSSIFFFSVSDLFLLLFLIVLLYFSIIYEKKNNSLKLRY